MSSFVGRLCITLCMKDLSLRDIWYYCEDRTNLNVKLIGQEIDLFASYLQNKHTFYTEVTYTTIISEIGNALGLRYNVRRNRDVHYLVFKGKSYLMEHYFGFPITVPLYLLCGSHSQYEQFGELRNSSIRFCIDRENPYSTLPQLNLYTYQMSEIIKDELQQGIEIDGETEEYAFDLNEFFAVTNGKFNHESSVDKFLDALTRQTKFPFSTEELRDELKHTFWLLDRVDSAKALAKKLREHPIFQEYEVVLAAGDGKLDDDEETMKSYDKVVAAIAQHEKTITLSVGQLTTGDRKSVV